MMNQISKIAIILVLLSGQLGCKTKKSIGYLSNNISVVQLTENTFIHKSYLSTKDFGKVSCNGMIVRDHNEVLIFDTPTNDADAIELIDWIENTLKCKVIGVVVTHFHNDCLGGLGAFHQRKIPSYAFHKTIAFATKDSLTVPETDIETGSRIVVGKKFAICQFLGEGHTADNIIGYFPSEKVLFGGCLIKEMNANKGYLGDANEQEWSKTVQKVKSTFGNAKWIIPGHGEHGGIELLDYTINLFQGN